MKDVTFLTITCAKDLHYAKCLLGSIRYYYPEHSIVVIADDDISNRHIDQLLKFSGIKVYRSFELRQRHNMQLTGLLTKLNLLFIPGLEKCLVMDADSVLVGPILDFIKEDDELLAFDGKLLDLNDSYSFDSFNKFAVSLEDLKPIDPTFIHEKVIYMNSGHFYLDVKKFPIQELYSNLSHLNTNFVHKGPFRFGDQGFINYVANKFNSNGLKVRYLDMAIMGKYPEIDFPNLNLKSISLKESNTRCIIHYTAPSRRHRIAEHNFGEILCFFENLFYASISSKSYYYDRMERRLKYFNKKLNKAFERKFSSKSY